MYLSLNVGEPPWKDRNLRGLMQLHALLVSWEGGPPPFHSPTPLSTDAMTCLSLCFQKQESLRPSATELLQSSFLKTRDLEDSGGSSHDVSFLSSHRDVLEESFTLHKLREAISAVQTNRNQHPSHIPSSHAPVVGVNEDSNSLIRQVDRQLQRPPGPGVGAAGVGGPLRSPPIQQQSQAHPSSLQPIQRQLPPPNPAFLLSPPLVQGGGGGGGGGACGVAGECTYCMFVCVCVYLFIYSVIYSFTCSFIIHLHI